MRNKFSFEKFSLTGGSDELEGKLAMISAKMMDFFSFGSSEL
jgi:hypothetical protein